MLKHFALLIFLILTSLYATANGSPNMMLDINIKKEPKKVGDIYYDKHQHLYLYMGKKTAAIKLNASTEKIKILKETTTETDITKQILEITNSDNKIIIIPSGTYLISSRISLNSNQTWLGYNSPTLKIIDKSLYPRLMLSIKNVHNIIIDGINFDGNASAQNKNDIINDKQKGLIEIQGSSSNIQIKNCTIKNSIQWGLLIKGKIKETTDKDGSIIKKSEIPKDITLDNINTEGSLGMDGQAQIGKTGKTGIALVAVDNIIINKGISEDFFDIEPNSKHQFVSGIITNRLFKGGADIADHVTFEKNTFLKPNNLPFAIRITQGGLTLKNNTIIDNKKNLDAWLGILILSNNTSDLIINNNTFTGTNMTAIAAISISRTQIKNNNFNINTTSNYKKINYNNRLFNIGAIIMSTKNDIMRDALIENNNILIISREKTNAIYLPSEDARRVTITQNSTYLNTKKSYGYIYYCDNAHYPFLIYNNKAHIINTMNNDD